MTQTKKQGVNVGKIVTIMHLSDQTRELARKRMDALPNGYAYTELKVFAQEVFRAALENPSGVAGILKLLKREAI